MRTAGNWIEVVVSGGMFGAIMALLNAKRWLVGTKAGPKVLFVVNFTLVGLWFGVMTTFRLQAFHPPLVFLNVSAFAGLVVASWFLWRLNVAGNSR